MPGGAPKVVSGSPDLAERSFSLEVKPVDAWSHENERSLMSATRRLFRAPCQGVCGFLCVLFFEEGL